MEGTRMAIDKVTLEVLNNYTHASAESMAYTLLRTAYTTFVKETQDFTTGLATPEGEVYAYPRYMAATWFVALNLGEASKLIKKYRENDIIITNDPYTSKFYVTHTPDVHLWKPIFYQGEIVSYATCHIHHTDVGGSVPATLSRVNTEIFQEGLRIPPQKLYNAGILNEELVEIIKTNVRVPEQNWGDIKAQVASLNTGEIKVKQMIERFGINTFKEGIHELLDYAEQKVRAIIFGIPNGDYFFSDYIDDDVISDMPIRIALNMKIKNDEVILDFTGSDPQLKCAMNVPTGGNPKHCLPGMALFYYFMTVDPSIPLNSAVMRPISLILPKGTVMNPEYPAAVGMRSVTIPRVQDATLGCLIKALPQKLPACSAGHATIIVVSLQNPTTGKRFVSLVEPLLGGGGGSAFHDGSDAAGGFLSFISNNPIEVNEADVPIEILQYELIQDSAGAGKYRGGLGVRLDFRVFHPNAIVTARNRDRNRFRPWGAEGGKAASLSAFIINPGASNERNLHDIDVVNLQPGDIVSMSSPGGGGYGNPLERDPKSVLRDFLSGYISQSGAEKNYGVVIHNNQLDLNSTEKLRHKMSLTVEDDKFDFGPERNDYDSVWSESIYTALTELLMEMPTPLRSFAKKEIYQEINLKSKKGAVKPQDIKVVWENIKNQYSIIY
jgi:N-methylhydantoinase B